MNAHLEALSASHTENKIYRPQLPPQIVALLPTMLALKPLILALTAVTGVIGAPFDFLSERDEADNSTALEKRAVTPNSSGTAQGYVCPPPRSIPDKADWKGCRSSTAGGLTAAGTQRTRTSKAAGIPSPGATPAILSAARAGIPGLGGEHRSISRPRRPD